MKLSPFFSLKPKKRLTLVLHIDVGQGNCRGALLMNGVEPQMLYTTFDAEKVTRNSRSKDIGTTLTSLKEVLEDVSKFITGKSHIGSYFHIEKVYAILSAPYHLSHTALIKYHEKKSFVVTPDLVSKLLSGYRKSTDPEFESHDEVEIGENPVTIGERIVHMKVNGYHTGNPYGKTTETLELGVFKTEVASEIVSGVEREVKKYFGAPVSFEPLSLAAYVALRDHVHFDPNFLFVVVGNEVTEVSLVRGFTLLETVSFPYGKHSLVRHLSREMKTTESTALGTLSLWSASELTNDHRKNIEPTLTGSAEKWFPFFEKALVSLSDQSTVPHAVYLVADNEVRNVFKMFIEADNFASQALVPSGFSVTPVDTELAKTLMRFGEKASCDTLLCLEGLFALSTKLPLHIRE